jgi:hypothetical protein
MSSKKDTNIKVSFSAEKTHNFNVFFHKTMGVIDVLTITCFKTTLSKLKYLMTMKRTYSKSKEL